MNNLINVRQKLLQEINQLPHEQLNVVLNFLYTLKSSSHQKIDKHESISIDFDPLADFIGAVDSGNLAKNIEQDLYG